MPNFSNLPRELRDMIYEQYILTAINDHGKAEPDTIKLTTAAPLLLSDTDEGVELAEVRIPEHADELFPC